MLGTRQILDITLEPSLPADGMALETPHPSADQARSNGSRAIINELGRTNATLSLEPSL